MAFSRKGPGATITGRRRSTYTLDYKDLDGLRKFLTPHGQILSRKRTGLGAQSQRELKLQVKRARHLALLPFVG